MKIALIISGLRGLFYASLEVAKRLNDRGCEVVFASTSDLEERLKPYGYDFVRLPSMHLPRVLTEDFHLQFQDAINSLNADSYIIDTECPVYVIAAKSLKKETFILNHFLPIPTRPDLPIPNLDIIPGEGFYGNQVMVPLSWMKKRLSHFGRATLDKIKNKGADRRSLLIRLARKMGLRKKDYLFSKTLLPGPYLYFADVPMLHITAEDLDFSHGLRQEEHYVGPMVFLDRKDSSNKEDEDQLEGIIKETKSSEKKLVYCALSSLKAVQESFVSTLIEGLKDTPNLQVIIGLGGKTKRPENEIPENFHFFNWVNPLKVLPHADAAIITAGFHTIHECLYFKVPVLSFSFSTTDQNGFQARIRAKKLGINGDFQSETPESLKHKVDELLNSNEFEAPLKLMSVHIKAYKKNQVLENLVLQSTPSELLNR